MEITDIRIRKVEAEGKMKAVVSVTFDNELLSMTSRLLKVRTACLSQCRAARHRQEFRDIAHPINADARNKVQNAILEKYQSMLAEEEAAGALTGVE